MSSPGAALDGHAAGEFVPRPVVEVARALIGCTVRHGGTAGMIVETEAYHDSEPAAHSFVGLTARTTTLFGAPGRAYVYRSYGIHALLNAVCEPTGRSGVLIRALCPVRDRLMRAGAASQPAAGGPPASGALLGAGKLTQALAV